MEQELKYDIRKLSPKEQEEVRKKIVREMQKRGDAKEVARGLRVYSTPCGQDMEKVSRGWNSYDISGKDGTSCGVAQKANAGAGRDNQSRDNREKSK